MFSKKRKKALFGVIFKKKVKVKNLNYLFKSKPRKGYSSYRYKKLKLKKGILNFNKLQLQKQQKSEFLIYSFYVMMNIINL